MAKFMGRYTNIKRGHIWRVGDGNNIDIWEDCWIPSSPNRRIMTRRGNILLIKVAELVDHEARVWDEVLIEGNMP